MRAIFFFHIFNMQKNKIAEININEFNYSLPQNYIAQHPLPNRDDARLLVLKDGKINDDVVKNIFTYLDDDTFLIFNNTKVIPARLLVQKDTGAWLEIFLLEPADIQGGYTQALFNKKKSKWRCLIGNAKRWKNDVLKIKFDFQGNEYFLYAEKTGVFANYFEIEFTWQAEVVFSEVLLQIGKTPLPPYINRNADTQDADRYQTIYARHEGSVAAPTAGLHFTSDLLQQIKEQKVLMDEIVLHVGAGTFKPVSSQTITAHTMHEEYIIFSIENIEKLLENWNKRITAIGTTSCRALESLYWLGAKIMRGYKFDECFYIGQWEPYEQYEIVQTTKESLQALKDYMLQHNLKFIHGFTQIIIVPGYDFKIIKSMVTNFHQPQSTLLLLIAAFIGEAWKKVYAHALKENYRFLSYGDACFFEKKQM